MRWSITNSHTFDFNVPSLFGPPSRFFCYKNVIVGRSKPELAEKAEVHGEPADEVATGTLAETRWEGPAKVAKVSTSDGTDDPVRLYLREISSVNLLSREGEVAIAKRIEAGRWEMIAGLCESPLTFQAIVIWRDELNDSKVLLRDIIDLEATYAGPDGRNAPKIDMTAPGVAEALAEQQAAPSCQSRVHAFTVTGQPTQITMGENRTRVRVVTTTRTTTTKTRCRSPPSRLNSSLRCWQRSTR
jgi:hypothetical protein